MIPLQHCLPIRQFVWKICRKPVPQNALHSTIRRHYQLSYEVMVKTADFVVLWNVRADCLHAPEDEFEPNSPRRNSPTWTLVSQAFPLFGA